MIFVTVGSHYQGFERLIKKMDEIAGKIDEKVIMQIGHSDYIPLNAEFFDFIESFAEIERLNREAKVVVSHAGAGCILTALGERTPVIVVPRLKMFGEHMNDHQLEIAKTMSENKSVKVVYDIDDLEGYLKMDLNFVEAHSEERLVTSLRNFLSDMSKK